MPESASPSRALLQFIRDSLPVSQREFEESSKETVQTVVWIVTLCTGLLSLAALNNKLLSTLSPSAITAELCLLLVTILFGVIQRILQHLANQLVRAHLRGLHGHLSGRSLEVATPPLSVTFQSIDSIVRSMQEHFGIDYSFLIPQNVPLATYQQAYDKHLEIWQKFDDANLRSIAQLLAAYGGKPSAWGDQLLAPKPSDLDTIRKTAKRLAVLGWAAFAAFVFTALCFLTAMLILGKGLLANHAAVVAI